MITTQPCKAQYLGLVFINANGTIEPTDAPIKKEGEIYRLTGDIESIRIKRSNIILNGNGHTIPASDPSSLPIGRSSNSNGVLLDSVENVVVMNLTVKAVYCGIFLDRTRNCTLVNNTITETTATIPSLQATAGIYVWISNSTIITKNQITSNYAGIYIGYFSEQNQVTQNNISDNTYGIIFGDSSNNSIYKNNFVNSMYKAQASELTNVWDNGLVGNYWSDYNGNGSYVINENNIDHYPLTTPIDIYEESNPTPSPPNDRNALHLELTDYLLPIGVIVAVCIALTILLYLRHRKAKSTKQ